MNKALLSGGSLAVPLIRITVVQQKSVSPLFYKALIISSIDS